MTTKKTQRKRALEIIHKIRVAGSSQAAIARLHKKKPAAVWNVIWGRSESKPIKQTIARITGESIDSLWPEDSEEDRAA